MKQDSVIKNISFDQKEILHNIMMLYNNGEPFDCDITASTLNFYRKKKNDKYSIPKPKYLFDVYPQTDEIVKITPFEKIPLEDNSIHSIVVDLPFLICPKTAPSILDGSDKHNKMQKRFSHFYPLEELIYNQYWWLKECFRVLDDGGIVVWKMQNNISGGKQIWSSDFASLAAQAHGFYKKDEFILQAKTRLISGKIKQQKHSRKYTSSFFVFLKDEKNKMNRYNILAMLTDCVMRENNNNWKL